MTDPRAIPYPADTRAKGWRFEIDHERIRQSDTWVLAAPELRPWLLMLWMTAWEQTPCGSLPDDDELIAARIGMPNQQFSECKKILLRGWWLADDGRLYHDTIVQKVIEMNEKREKDAIRRGRNRGQTQSHASVPRDNDVTPTDSIVTVNTKHLAPSTSKKDLKDYVIPDGINRDAWSEWAAYRKSKNKKISPKAAEKQFEFLLSHPPNVQAQIINQSISNDYQGLFDLRGSGNAAHKQPNHQRPDNSAAGRVRANVAAEIAAARSNSEIVAAHVVDVRPQMGEQLRGSGGPGQRVGVVLEGSFSRTD